MKSPWRATPAGVVRRGDWKLIEFFEDSRAELYNLADDIGETTDLADVRPQKTKELRDLLHRWQRDVDAPIPSLPNPDFGKEKK